MGVEEVIATFQTGTYTVRRTAVGSFVFGKYILPQPWETSTAYTVGTRITNGAGGAASTYQCTTAGTSASSGSGPSGTGSAIADGSCVWEFVQANIITIAASVRPIREGRELEPDAEGEYGSEDVYVFTLTELRTRSPNTPDTESDIIELPSTSNVLEDWQIIAVKRGRTFYRATARRVVLP